MASTPPDRDADGTLSCPDCYGPIWDNRKKKADGTFNRKSPDFACKDKDDCDWAYWLEKPSGNGGGGGGGKRRKKKKKPPPKRSGGGGGGGRSGGSEAPLGVALYNAFQTAKQVVGKLQEDEFEIMSEKIMVPELAKELFRAHVETGAPFMSKAKPKKKKPPPPPPEEEEEDEAADEDEGGYEYVSDDDLPF